MKRIITLVIMAICSLSIYSESGKACTGITLKTKDGRLVLARTIEWGGSELKSQYVVVPRGYRQQSLLPGFKDYGLQFTSKYGYVGLSVEQKDFIVEGINEEGLSAGLFYFPHYGSYLPYEPAHQSSSLSDLQLVSWLLGSFKSVDEAVEGLKEIRVVAIDPRSSTVHWRIADPSGRQVVIEIVNGEVQVHENTLGILTNSPGFEWQMTNLNNYINLSYGTTPPHQLGTADLSSFGAGSNLLGLPGDITPPSRFVRAAFFQATAPIKATPEENVITAFHLLNNFDIPIGTEFDREKLPADIPSATQWTSATDLSGRVIYFRTMFNSRIRSIDLKKIDFSKVSYQVRDLDVQKREEIEEITITNKG